MVAAAAIARRDRVLEIGTGRGELTAKLAGLGSSFDGYEVDRENYLASLKKVGGGTGRVHLADPFKSALSFDVLVASLPYSRSGRFIEWLSCSGYRRAVVLLQRDFVEKIILPPGSRDYRAVTVIAQASSTIEPMMLVGREAFDPPPEVESQVVRFTPSIKLTLERVNRIKRLFSLRRKKVATALALIGHAGTGQGFEQRRVSSLTPSEVLQVCSSDWGP